MKTIIQLHEVEKQFGQQTVIPPLSLAIAEGEFLTLLGPSGCGKTTLLRMIAGFEHPTSGEILLDGQPISQVPPYKRDMNMVFQHYALFPHMTVEENILFGLKMKKVPAAEQQRRLEEVLQLTHLGELRRRMPRQLSGGQQQRVAIARAIINNPKVLLLDEPLGALDYQLRKNLQLELKNLQKNLGITFIYVTHDQEEAMAMSDRIAVMNRGVIEQLGTPQEIYLRPKSLFVATFIGENNLFRHRDAFLAVRPEKVKVYKMASGGEQPRRTGRIADIVFLGSLRKIFIQLEAEETTVLAHENGDADPVWQIGERVGLGWAAEDEVTLPC
jgi:spermidine/putrescine transport system ATP-binding protein